MGAMTKPLTLVEFLTARLDEDEAVARDATDDGHMWLVEEETISLYPDDREPFDGFMSFPRKAHAHHAATWDPPRVLREVEAKRRIVELHAIAPPDSYTTPSGREVRVAGMCVLCTADDEYRYAEPDGTEHPCDTLLALASVYSDHPDYREGGGS